MFERQLIASVIIGLCLLVLIIRLVQRGHLDIAYCWLWLGIGAGILVIVLRYDWLERFAHLLGAVTPTTALFLLGFVVILLLCLQFSMVVSTHRRQIKKLTQHLALLERNRNPVAPCPPAGEPPGGTPSP